MKVTIVGCGEATEPELGHSSVLVQDTSVVLVDCGPAVPAMLFPLVPEHSFLDSIYITHFHADHTFGLPTLLIYLDQLARTKPLQIIGQPGVEKFLTDLFELGYPGKIRRLSFPLRFTETTSSLQVNELDLSFAPTLHSISCYAVKVASNGKLLAISGDGELTEESKALFSDVQLLIHESYTVSEHLRFHSSITEVIEFAKTLPKLKTLMLIHLNRQQRAAATQYCAAQKEQLRFELIIPTPRQSVTL